MSIKTRATMPVICLPSEDFSYENLSAASSYNESGLSAGPPVKETVAGSYDIHLKVPNELSNKYDIDFKVNRSGRIIDNPDITDSISNFSTYLWRDNTVGAATNHWMGRRSSFEIADVLTVNQSEGSSTNQYQKPRAVFDKEGRLYVIYKYDQRIGINIRDTDGTWTEKRTTTNAAVLSSQNNAPSAGSDVAGDIVYVESEDRLYIFWPSWSGTDMSIGISYSADHGDTWEVLTNQVVEFGSTYGPTTTNDITQVRALYNPLSDTFTISYLHNLSDDTVKTMTVQRGLFGSTFPPATFNSIYPRTNYDQCIDKATGYEYLFAWDNAGTTLYAYRKAPGEAIWTLLISEASLGVQTTAGLSAIMTTTGWPALVCRRLSGTYRTTFFYLFARGNDDWRFQESEVSYNFLGGTSYLQNIQVIYDIEGHTYILGNPQAVSATHEDNILIYVSSGYSNVPAISTRSFLTPADQPQDQATPDTWTESTSGLGSPVADSRYDSTYKQIVLYTNVGTTGTAYAYWSTDLATESHVEFITKVRVLDAITSNTSTSRDGHAWIQITGDDGVDTNIVSVLCWENGFRVRDATGGTWLSSAQAVTMLNTEVWFKCAYDKDNWFFSLWYSLDGDVWTRVLDRALLTTSATGLTDEISVAFGVNADGTIGPEANWGFASVQTNSTTITSLMDYNDYTAAVTDEISLTGQTFSNQFVPITKGLFLRSPGGYAIQEDYWTLRTVASLGVANVLVDGSDSPRIYWSCDDAATTTETLIWDFDSEAFNYNRGFVYFEGTGATNVLFKRGTQNLVNQNLVSVIGTNTWARSGNVFRPTATNSSIKYYEPNELKGSYLIVDSTYYFEITDNTPGYWSSTQDKLCMRITVSGDLSARSSTGSSLSYQPKRNLFFYQLPSSEVTTDNDFTFIVTVGGGSGTLKVNTIRMGRFFPLAVDPAPGYSRGWFANHEVSTSRSGITQGIRLGPSGRTRNFSFTTVETSDMYSGSSISNHTVSWEGTQSEADAHDTARILEYAVHQYGQALPIIWCDNQGAISLNGFTWNVNTRDFIFGRLAPQISVTQSMPGYYGKVVNISDFSVVEVV